MNPGHRSNDIQTKFKERWFKGELDDKIVDALRDENSFTRTLNLTNEQKVIILDSILNEHARTH